MNKKINLLALFLLTGCSVAPKQNNLYYLPGQARLFTKEVKQELFHKEIHDSQSQSIAISLSGGGTRSASFSIGALAGLYDSGVLQHTDVISTVSGGGYAGYFLFNSLYYSQKVPKASKYGYSDLFRDCIPSFPAYEKFLNKSYSSIGSKCNNFLDERKNDKFRFQYHLAQNADILYIHDYNLLEFGGKVLSDIPTLPLHHISNSLFDWGVNFSSIRKFYQNGLERTYGLIPLAKADAENTSNIYENSQSLPFIKNFKTRELTFSQLHDFTLNNWESCSIEKRDNDQCTRIPLWIINATAGVSTSIYEWTEGRPPMNKSVFEMTPLGYGSDEYGYSNSPLEQITIPQAVAISGAAVDAQQKSTKGVGTALTSVGLHLANLNLGYTINNYNPERANIYFHKILPWPLYYLHGFSRNKDSVDIYLSDGGHSENLGAYSLIIRGIKNVIIIDAEHDHNGKFEALHILRKALLNQHGLTLNMDDLDIDKEFTPFNSSKSIFQGKVTGFRPGYISDKIENNFVKIFYVKSSINPEKMSSTCDSDSSMYPCTVYSFYLNNNLAKNKNLFPHHSTALTAVKSSPSIYYAYRDLAKYITSKIKYKKGTLSVDDD